MVYGLSALCLVLFILWIDAKLKTGKETIRYIDRSGINKNPPQFIEVWKNKTINFNLNGKSISIPHLPILENLEYISNIAGLFKALKEGVDVSFGDPLKPQAPSKKIMYLSYYHKLIALIYKISRPHSKGLFYKYRFYKKAMADSQWLFGICEQVFDYWLYMGKLIVVLSKGVTPRMTYGESLSSGRLKWDSQGTRLIEPRYAFIPKSKLKRL